MRFEIIDVLRERSFRVMGFVIVARKYQQTGKDEQKHKGEERVFSNRGRTSEDGKDRWQRPCGRTVMRTYGPRL